MKRKFNRNQDADNSVRYPAKLFNIFDQTKQKARYSPAGCQACLNDFKKYLPIFQVFEEGTLMQIS